MIKFAIGIVTVSGEQLSVLYRVSESASGSVEQDPEGTYVPAGVWDRVSQNNYTEGNDKNGNL